MELYLRWLDKHEREPDEQSPLGIILCTGKKTEQIELLELDRSGIHVAEYMTALPPRKLLGEKLHLAAERMALQRTGHAGPDLVERGGRLCEKCLKIHHLSPAIPDLAGLAEAISVAGFVRGIVRRRWLMAR